MPMKTRDLTGLTFGRLTVIEKIPPTHKHERLWKCSCECGGEKVTTHGRLTSGNCKSCGCIQKENAYKLSRCNIKYSSTETGIRHAYAQGKCRASRKNRGWIPYQTWLELSLANCYYCGSPPEQRLFKTHQYAINGIDRLDSTQGYITENIVTCCRQCNTAKLAYTRDEYIEKCIQVANNFRS